MPRKPLETNMALLETKQVEQFQRDGYVVIPDLLSDTELDHFQPLVRDAVAKRKRFDTRPLSEKSLYEQSFLQCMNLWEDFPAIKPLTFHPKVAQAAAELIGAPTVRLWHDQALFKEAGGRETDPHQDLPYWTMTESDALTAWIPLTGSSEENGCMGYLPGSHKNTERTFVDIFRRGDTSPEDQAKAILTGELTFVEVPRGSVAFHHGLTAHGAMANRSQATREVHTMIYFRDGMTRSAEGQHHAVDRADIQPGKPITSDVTPVAWPRSDLPPAPKAMELPEFLVKSGAFPQK